MAISEHHLEGRQLYIQYKLIIWWYLPLHTCLQFLKNSNTHQLSHRPINQMPTILTVRYSPTEHRSPRSSSTIYQHSYLFPDLEPGHLGFFARSLTGPGNPLSGAITWAARRQINQNHIRLFRHLSFSFYCLLLTRKCAHCAATALGIYKVCKNVISSSYYHGIRQRLSEFPAVLLLIAVSSCFRF